MTHCQTSFRSPLQISLLASTGTSAGVGFAIPSSTVLKIVPQLIQFSKVSMKKIPCFFFLIGLSPSIFGFCLMFLLYPKLQVLRAGINIELAPDPVANQLNVRNGALVLQVCKHFVL